MLYLKLAACSALQRLQSRDGSGVHRRREPTPVTLHLLCTPGGFGQHARTEQEPIQVELEAKVPQAVVLRDIPDWRAKVPNLTVSATKDHLTTLRLLEECDWAHEGCALRAGASARNTGLLAVMASTMPNDSELSAMNDAVELTAGSESGLGRDVGVHTETL